MLPKFENFLGQVKDGFKSIEELKMKIVGMSEPLRMVTFVALGGIATLLNLKKEKVSPHGPNWKKSLKKLGVQN